MLSFKAFDSSLKGFCVVERPGSSDRLFSDLIRYLQFSRWSLVGSGRLGGRFGEGWIREM